MLENNTRSRGLIDQFESIDIDVRKCCEMVADELVKKGLFEDAVKLYDLAEVRLPSNFSKKLSVLSIDLVLTVFCVNNFEQNEQQCLHYLSVLLSPVVHQVSKKGSLRERLYVKALEYSKRYSDTPHCDSHTRATFSTLRDLVKFFDEYHEQKYQLALETLTQLKLVPLHVNDLEICVNNFKRFVLKSLALLYSDHNYSNHFEYLLLRLGGEVNKVFPDLLLATMDIIHTQYKNLKGRDGYAFNTDENKERVRLKKRKTEFIVQNYFIYEAFLFVFLQQLINLREQAKAVTNMAATVPYRMPGDISSRLVQTEILMH